MIIAMIAVGVGGFLLGYGVKYMLLNDDLLDAMEDSRNARAGEAKAKEATRLAVLRMKEAFQSTSRLATRISNQRRVIKFQRERIKNPQPQIEKGTIKKLNKAATEVLASTTGH